MIGIEFIVSTGFGAFWQLRFVMKQHLIYYDLLTHIEKRPHADTDLRHPVSKEDTAKRDHQLQFYISHTQELTATIQARNC